MNIRYQDNLSMPACGRVVPIDRQARLPALAAQPTFNRKTLALRRQWPLRSNCTGPAAALEKNCQKQVMAEL